MAAPICDAIAASNFWFAALKRPPSWRPIKLMTPTVLEPPEPGEYRIGTDRNESGGSPASRSADVGCRDAMIALPSRNTIAVMAPGSSGDSGLDRPSWNRAFH